MPTRPFPLGWMVPLARSAVCVGPASTRSEYCLSLPEALVPGRLRKSCSWKCVHTHTQVFDYGSQMITSGKSLAFWDRLSTLLFKAEYDGPAGLPSLSNTFAFVSHLHPLGAGLRCPALHVIWRFKHGSPGLPGKCFTHLATSPAQKLFLNRS